MKIDLHSFLQEKKDRQDLEEYVSIKKSDFKHIISYIEELENTIMVYRTNNVDAMEFSKQLSKEIKEALNKINNTHGIL